MAARLRLKVIPASSRNAISGWLDDTLKIQVTAAPERGKANKAVVALLCKSLGLPRNAVRVLQGETSQTKVVEIDGLSLADIHELLPRTTKS
ncbi:MAG: DUF167 domain-containing protein [Chromatiales bacterium]|nr:DUF167 domain-containing protein [Chromatiales bacterium]